MSISVRLKGFRGNVGLFWGSGGFRGIPWCCKGVLEELQGIPRDLRGFSGVILGFHEISRAF